MFISRLFWMVGAVPNMMNNLFRKNMNFTLVWYDIMNRVIVLNSDIMNVVFVLNSDIMNLVRAMNLVFVTMNLVRAMNLLRTINFVFVTMNLVFVRPMNLAIALNSTMNLLWHIYMMKGGLNEVRLDLHSSRVITL